MRLIDVAKIGGGTKRKEGMIYAVMADGSLQECTTRTQLMFYRRLTTNFIGGKGEALDFQEINNALYREVGHYV